MALVDAGVVWIAVLLAIALFSLVAVVLGLVVRVLKLGGRAVRAVLWPVWRAGQGCGTRTGPARARRPRPCPEPRCGHVNPPAARFCARCGRRLGSGPAYDDYG